MKGEFRDKSKNVDLKKYPLFAYRLRNIASSVI